MTIKKKEERVSRSPQARSLREKNQSRWIIIGFIITVVFIVGFAGYALLYETVLKNFIPVAKVDGTKIDNEYFKDRVRLERNAYIQQYQMLSAQYQMFADDPSASEYYLQQLAQVQQTLDSEESVGESILDRIIEDQVIAEEAAKMGISVSDEEVENEMQGLFGFFPGGTPTPQPTPTIYSTPTLTSLQKNLLDYTPTPIQIQPNILEDQTSPTPTEETTEPMEEDAASPTDSEAQPETEPTATITPIAATATLTPTATVYTEEIYQSNYQDYLKDLEAINVRESSLRKYLYFYLLKQKVQDEVVRDVSPIQEQVWARHILIKTKAEAIIVLSRLENGEQWAAVAADVSIDTSNKDNGGDLGWFSRGQMVAPFEEAAFDLSIGETSQPFETDFGWHVIQVIGHEQRPVSNEEYQNILSTKFDEWLEKNRDSYQIKINEVWRDLVPKEPTIPEENRVY